MKTINVTFEDKEIEGLIEKKGDISWHDFIIRLAKKSKGFTLKVVEKKEVKTGANKK